MVYVIMSSGGYRNQEGRGWVSKAMVFLLSSLAVSLGAGAVLGAAGSHLSTEVRLGLSSFLGLVAIGLGTLELGTLVGPLQFNRETPQRWMHAGALTAATRNGMTLGLGATTRIGFWLWYTIPAGALLTASPVLGAAVYGTYGLVRGLTPWVFILSQKVTPRARVLEPEKMATWLVRHWRPARTLAAAQLIFIGAAIVVAIGL